MKAYFKYELPEELIADRPLEERDGSRLMILERATGKIIHRNFFDLEEYVVRGDLLVMNNTKVLPALIRCEGRHEFTLIESLGGTNWVALTRSSKKLVPGMRLKIDPPESASGADGSKKSGKEIYLEMIEKKNAGAWSVALPPETSLEKMGSMPLPPYIRKARRRSGASYDRDSERYQTVIAKEPGSVAAPTAGLHFTPELLAKFDVAEITLHVGAGTFRPVRDGGIENHVMHREHFFIPEGLRQKADAAKRLVACGTTTVRALESRPGLEPGQGSTEIFIRPPFQFQRVQALITNFHLPESTLLCLVAAFAGEGFIAEAYREAIRERYRFFSYGDAMLIV